ncbi:MAG TPA: sugar transferase, partial [Armatimonadota bacterium]|nr:sugar transferase [Armatimonadota bacterium]
PLSLYLQATPVVIALWLAGFVHMNLYDVRRFQSPLAEFQAVVGAVSIATVLVAGASFLSHIDFSRAMLVLFWAAGLVFTTLERALMAGHRRRALTRRKNVSRAAVVGVGELGRVVADRVRRYQSLGYELVGFVAANGAPDNVGGYPVLGRLEELPRIIAEHHIDEVLVALPDLDVDLLMGTISACRNLSVQFNLIAGPLHMLVGSAQFSDFADLQVLPLERRHFPWWQAFIKRLLDILVSVTLLVLSLPVWVVATIVIRRETGASAVFRQTRMGLGGESFTMLKFRTMKPSADPYALAPTDEDDERITRFGRWLRRYSLDELPQLLNIIRGDMSLVGPRPEMPFLVEQYRPWQRRRLEVRPGLTGLWQILGRKDLPLAENIEYDFYYINNRSLLLDLVILLRTIPVVLLGRGAY